MIRTFVFFALCACCKIALGLTLDEKIGLIKKVYSLKPQECLSTQSGNKSTIEAGKLLFESTILSGDRDVSCRMCHLEEFNGTDGNPIAIGVGATGEGKKRMQGRSGTLVQRNVLPLEGRANKQFTTYFWDGKVQKIGTELVTPFGNINKDDFESPLAAASIVPIMERDELVGKIKYINDNDIQKGIGDTLYYERYIATSKAIRKRIFTGRTEEDRTIKTAVSKAGIKVPELELSDIGNLIAQFIQNEFPCKTSRWDRYLIGDNKSLNEDEKKGAIIFYGKGRCASCHSGNNFSDMGFHSIGVPQGAFGPHARHRDIGRGQVTQKRKDLYKFRTPPLTSVALTAPYGHNGIFDSLEDVVTHHFNPVAFYVLKQEYLTLDKFDINKLLASRDDILQAIDLYEEEQLYDLIAFLRTL